MARMNPDAAQCNGTGSKNETIVTGQSLTDTNKTAQYTTNLLTFSHILKNNTTN